MILSNFLEAFAGRIRIHGFSETLICKKCGKEYASRGKKDPGICRECELENTFIGGPLDGVHYDSENEDVK